MTSKSKLLAVGAALVTLNMLFLAYLWRSRQDAGDPAPAGVDPRVVERRRADPTAPDAVVKLLDSELVALRGTGMPAEARDVNAFYVIPDGASDTTRLWVDAIEVVRLAKLGERGSMLPIIGTGKSPIPVPGQPWDDLEASRTLLDGCATELQAVRKAAAAGGQGRFPVDFSAGSETLLPHAQEARQVARMLDLSAWVNAHDGKGAQALEDVKGIFALSNALRGEPIFITQLVRIAIYAVACDTAARLIPYCAWSDADLTSLQSLVQSADFKGEMARACCGERALCVTELNATLPGPPHQADARAMLRLFDKAISSFSGSWPDVLSQQNELAAEAARLQRIIEVLPSIEQAANAGVRATARQRCLAAATAVERYRLQHHEWPGSLADIQGLFASGSAGAADDLADPYNGKPLRYKADEKRAVIYSVGVNLTDDGGDVNDFSEPKGQQSLDLGVIVKAVRP